jgi:hypothetical protein
VTAAPAAAPVRPFERKLPPVSEIGAASMVAIVVSVIWMAAYLPKQAPLWLPILLLSAAAALQAVNWVVVARIRPFARDRFFQVARWTLLAYAVIAGMIEFAFIYDQTRGARLALLTIALLLFMLNVPMLVAFTVARYQAVEE